MSPCSSVYFVVCEFSPGLLCGNASKLSENVTFWSQIITACNIISSVIINSIFSLVKFTSNSVIFRPYLPVMNFTSSVSVVNY